MSGLSKDKIELLREVLANTAKPMKTRVGDRVVSTAEFPLADGYRFETLVFHAKSLGGSDTALGEPDDDAPSARCLDPGDAEANHARIVAKLRS